MTYRESQGAMMPQGTMRISPSILIDLIKEHIESAARVALREKMLLPEHYRVAAITQTEFELYNNLASIVLDAPEIPDGAEVQVYHTQDYNSEDRKSTRLNSSHSQ